VAKLLLRREDVDPNRPDKYDRTLLGWAALYGHKGVVRLLLACSQPSRADGRALADYSPGQGGYRRPGKASVFHKDGSPMG